MDGLYTRRTERFRLDYLKERGGICRVVQMIILGAVLGFLGMSPESGRATYHVVVTAVVLATVTVALLGRLLKHRRRFCFSSARSWTIVETVHDVVGVGLLVPGAIMLILPPQISPLTVAAVLTLFGLLVLGVQALENFQRARGYSVPSCLATPVPIRPVHTRQMMEETRLSSLPSRRKTTPTPDVSPDPDANKSQSPSLNVEAPASARTKTPWLAVSPQQVTSAHLTPLQTPSGRLSSQGTPMAFLTPYETPSAIPTSSSYHTPSGPFPPAPSPAAWSAFSSPSSSSSASGF